MGIWQHIKNLKSTCNAACRALEADKAAVARQLALGCNFPALPALPAPPAQDSGMSSQSADWGSASCHCDGMQEMAQTTAQLQAQLLLSQSSCQVCNLSVLLVCLQHALHALARCGLQIFWHSVIGTTLICCAGCRHGDQATAPGIACKPSMLGVVHLKGASV